jgi:hypothetical protein
MRARVPEVLVAQLPPSARGDSEASALVDIEVIEGWIATALPDHCEFERLFA